MELPKVRDANGVYSRRLHPISCNIYDSLQPLSTVNMTLPPDDDINNLDWVEVYTPDGTKMYCQVQNVSTDTETGEKTVYMEHGACLFDDVLIIDPGGLNSLSWSGTITQILTNIVSKQARWTVGTVEATDTIYIEPGGMSLMTACLTMMQSIPNYQLEFVQDNSDNWHIDIKRRPTTVACEGRLNRNLRSCDISYNAADICTRVYCEGLTGGKMDSVNINVYGVHEETMSLNEALSAAQKTAIVSSYLAAHDHPSLSVRITAFELSQITGLPIDKFVKGTVCRIAVPWLGIVENEVIIDKRYSDAYNRPEEVTLTLANATPDLSIAIANITGGGYSGGGGGLGNSGKGGVEAQKKRYETKFEKSDRHFRLIATDTEWDEMENGTITAYGQIVLTSSSFQTVIAQSGTVTEVFDDSKNYSIGDEVLYNGVAYRFKTDHSANSGWIGTDAIAIPNLRSMINQNADNISLVVGADGKVIPASIIAAITNQNGVLTSQITIDAENVHIGNEKSTTVINGKAVLSDVTAEYISNKLASVANLQVNKITAGSIDITVGSGQTVSPVATQTYVSGSVYDMQVVKVTDSQGADTGNYKIQVKKLGGNGSWVDVSNTIVMPSVTIPDDLVLKSLKTDSLTVYSSISGYHQATWFTNTFLTNINVTMPTIYFSNERRWQYDDGGTTKTTLGRIVTGYSEGSVSGKTTKTIYYLGHS